MFFRRKKKEEIIEAKPIEKKEEKLPEVIFAEVVDAKVVEEEIGEDWKKQSSKSLDEIEKKIDRMDSRAEWKLKKRFETKFGEKLETPTEAILKEGEEVKVEVPKIRKEKVSKKKVEEAFEIQLGIKKEEPKVIAKEEKLEVKPKIETKEDEQKVKFKKVEEVKIPTEKAEEVEVKEEMQIELPKEVPIVQPKEKKWYNIKQLFYLTKKKKVQGKKKFIWMLIDIILFIPLTIVRVLYLPIRFLKKRKAKKMGISESQETTTKTQEQIPQTEGQISQEGVEVQKQISEKKWYNIRQLYLTRKKQPKGAKKIVFMIVDIFLWIALLIPRVLYLPIRFLKKRKARKMANTQQKTQ